MNTLVSFGARTIRCLVRACLSICGVMPALAVAQVPPDAGQVQRQLEQTLKPPVVQPPQPAPATEPVDRTGPTIVLRRVVIEGATLIPAEELAHQLDRWVGQRLTLGELQAAAQSLVGYYRARGWFVRALLPEQDVSDGTLRVQIVEGRFGAMRLPDGNKTRADQGYVARVVGRHLEAGQPYSLADLERGLLLANDLPGISADGVLQAGGQLGTSDLALTVHDQPWGSGSAAVNDFGNRSTGVVQGSASLALNDPSGHGDQLTMGALGAGHLDYQSAGYSVPLGYDGLRANISYDQMHYHLAADFINLDAGGEARNLSAGLTYPLVRGTSRNLWLSLDYGSHRYRDASFGLALHDRHSDTYAVDLFGDRRDGLGGGGMTSWRVGLTTGRISLRLPDDRIQDATGPDVAGGFAHLNVELRRDQVLAAAYYLRSRLTGQWGFDNLDSTQQFSLGGPYGVRGYPVNEGSGDSGAQLQLEIHSLLPSLRVAGLDGYLFCDAGVVRQRHNIWEGWDTQGTDRNTSALYGTGAGLRWSAARGLALDTLLAVPLGHDLTISERDRDQDGSRHGLRVWVGLSQTF